MRAGADARIFAIAPIDEIVPAFGAGARVVGDLIGRQAGAGGHFLRHVPQGALRVHIRARASLPASTMRSNIVSGSMVS